MTSPGKGRSVRDFPLISGKSRLVKDEYDDLLNHLKS